MKPLPHATVVGIAVFVFGLGMACFTGYVAHSMTHEHLPPDPMIDALLVMTVIFIAIASSGMGAAVYGFEFEDSGSHANAILKFSIVVGAIASTFCFGTAIWAALVTIHMEEYGLLGSWSLVGFLLGSLGGVATTYGLSSVRRRDLRKQRKRF